MARVMRIDLELGGVRAISSSFRQIAGDVRGVQSALSGVGVGLQSQSGGLTQAATSLTAASNDLRQSAGMLQRMRLTVNVAPVPPIPPVRVLVAPIPPVQMQAAPIPPVRVRLQLPIVPPIPVRLAFPPIPPVRVVVTVPQGLVVPVQASPIVLTGLQQASVLQLRASMAFALAVRQFGALRPSAGTGGGPGGGNAANGPLTRLQQAWLRFSAAQQGGNPTAQFDTFYRLQQARTSFQRAQDQMNPQSRFMSAITAAILSTRINLPRIGGVGVSPLVGRTLAAAGFRGKEAAGIAVGLGAFTIGMSLAVAGLHAFAESVGAAYQALREAAAARYTSGGTAGQIAGLQGLGLSAAQIPGLAAGVQGARATNPFAMATFGPTLPRPFGNANEAEGLQGAIETILNISTEEGRLRAARLAELDSILPLIEAIRRNRDAYQSDAKAREAIQSKGTLAAANDLSFALQRVQGNFSLVFQAISAPGLEMAAAALNTFADVLKISALGWQENAGVVKAAMEAMMMAGKAFFDWTIDQASLTLGTLAALDPIHRKQFQDMQVAVKGMGFFMEFQYQDYMGKLQAAGDQTSATKANTQATQDLTALMGKMFGGGDRAKGSVPSHMLPSIWGSAGRYEALQAGYWKL